MSADDIKLIGLIVGRSGEEIGVSTFKDILFIDLHCTVFPVF